MTKGAVVVVALLLGASRGGATEPHPLVRLEVDPCVDVSESTVRRLVGIELDALLTDAGEAGADTTRATVGCVGNLISLRVDDPITGKSLGRTIDLSTAQSSARVRLLAVAVSELVSASWTELESNPQPRVPPVERVASTEARTGVRAAVEKRASLSPTRLRLLGLFAGQALFHRTGLLVGGGLRAALDRHRGLALSVDLLALHGGAETALGHVTIDALNAGPTMCFHRGWSLLDLRIAGGLRGGAVRLEGLPNAPMVRGTTAWGGWLGPMIAVSSTARLARNVAFELSVESGYVVVPLGGLVGGSREVAIDGPWIGFQIGLGVFL